VKNANIIFKSDKFRLINICRIIKKAQHESLKKRNEKENKKNDCRRQQKEIWSILPIIFKHRFIMTLFRRRVKTQKFTL